MDSARGKERSPGLHRGPTGLEGLQLSQQPHGEDLGMKGESHPMGLTLSSDDGGREVADG